MVTLQNGNQAWSFSSSQYTQAAVGNVEKYLKEYIQYLSKRALYPFKWEYRPEADVTTELDTKGAAYYQSLIGVLRWIVELSRADIFVEASMMASYMAAPRQGYLDQVLHIFAYLKQNHNCEMIFDPTPPDIDGNQFPVEDWSASVYNGAKEILLSNSPELRGKGFFLRMFVDLDHAGMENTRRSRTGFICFANNAPMYWSSKGQGCVQTNSFGLEFTAS
mmetsp:Transcript_15066/g.21511  ORF Transcript_15066/g.21511 Transcript_15066/m.21511 type:complete len:220 (+) Transcript_15066:414-1073(+)